MRRREFMAFLGGAALAWPLAARAQQPTAPLIGFLSSRSPEESAGHAAACLQGLKAFGYVDGKTATVEYRWAKGAYERLPALAISPDVRHNVFLASKEAVTNVVRHAKATSVRIRLRLDAVSFTLEIEDNGCGIADPNAPSVRNGLRNMRKRMDDIGGIFSIGRGTEGGTLVRLTVPFAKNNIES